MGGFAIDTDMNSEKRPETFASDHLPKNRTRFTLTPAGILFLVEKEPQMFPKISEVDIKDKSKASGLAKILVCFQTAWFCLQCITRLAYGLPICLLELNTLAHAICTLFIYALWWDKPLDIEQPTLIPLGAGQSL